jgi:hypothetical protein
MSIVLFFLAFLNLFVGVLNFGHNPWLSVFNIIVGIVCLFTAVDSMREY